VVITGAAIMLFAGTAQSLPRFNLCTVFLQQRVRPSRGGSVPAPPERVAASIKGPIIRLIPVRRSAAAAPGLVPVDLMSPRHRRLLADLVHMNELADQTSAVDFRADGDPPETYAVLISAAGIARDNEGELTVRRVHRCTVYLHSDYPRRPPVINWLTPIMHPNILPPERNGGVCLGFWSASESLADVVRRLIDLVTYRTFNTTDALDKTAAAWITDHGVRPGVDLQSLVGRNRIEDGEQVVVSLTRKNGS
jgi:ubiquitin-protein ligase